MVLQILHIADILLWIVPAGSVAYVAFFAFVSLLRNRQQHSQPSASAFTESPTRFMVLFPAYHEDTVIRRSVSAFLRQDYSADHYQLVVISDHMQADTNEWLASQPLTLLQPVFEKSSKAKALQYAVERVENGERREEREKWRIVILDADNIVESDFLSRLDCCCRQGHRAIQCHRTAKNADNDIAALDGLSEEINNTIFRRAHNRVGLSSALIGSGMCFSYQWFKDNVEKLDSAVEDRELVEAAQRATESSFSPYSHFQVGAAARLSDGTIFMGSNQEAAAFPSGMCAERTTLFAALAQHPDLKILSLAIAAQTGGHFLADPITPCGACRQFLAEFTRDQDIEVLCAKAGNRYVSYKLSELLPYTFNF